MSQLDRVVDSGFSSRERLRAFPNRLSHSVYLQYLRGAAALAVLLYHASFYAEQKFGYHTLASIFNARFGLYGVAVFFAISGFLMAHLINESDPWTFMCHRVARIYPLFWIVSVAAFLVDGMGPNWLISLTLAPAGERVSVYRLGIEWTLVFECTYYFLLFLLAATKLNRYLNGIVVGWLFVIAVSHLIEWNDMLLFPPQLILFSSTNVAFAGGLLLPSLLKRGIIPRGASLIVIIVWQNSFAYGFSAARWFAALAAVGIVADAVRLTPNWRPNRILARLGDWSYAIYLCHVTIVLAVYRFWFAAYARSAWIAGIGAALVIASLIGMFDVWLYRMLKRRLDAADQRWRMTLSIVYGALFVGAMMM
jgi:peptidoglycan/LPS O-acetylase OafA/YrhL